MHLFTIQARQAAIESRRRFAQQNPVGAPQLFVVRHEDSQLFGWEIRRFGGIVLAAATRAIALNCWLRRPGKRLLRR